MKCNLCPLQSFFSLTALFITSCPPSNPPLPFKAFPTLKAIINGNKAMYLFNAKNSPTGTSYYAAYYHGLNIQTAPLDLSKEVTIPDGLQGMYFTVIMSNGCFPIALELKPLTLPQTMASDGNVTDANTIAGPLITVSNFPTSAKN